MFKLFRKKKKKDESSKPSLLDINGDVLIEGDRVESLRYDLGNCRISIEDGNFMYTSEASGKKVSWVNMVDAISQNQKVKKIE